jgi:hypothetical protein
MIRTLAAVISVVLLSGLIGGANAQNGKGKISVTATYATVRHHAHLHVEIFRIWKRSITGVPIGSAYVVCDELGTGDVLGGGISSCQVTFHFPLGKITAAGIRHSVRHWSMVITGGTGIYLGAQGSVHRREHLPGEPRFILFLE